jgi:sugar/nucleoside kinase (ribokinase family)
MRSGIVCSGVSCLDLFLYGTAPLITRESLSMVGKTQYRPGGATSNTGRALARLGVPVEFMTVIGADANGDILLDLWRQDGIGTGCVVRSTEAGTALSTIPVYEDGKRGVYFCPGTNELMGIDNLFGPDREYLEVLRGRLAFHIGYPPLMRRLQGRDLAEVLSAVRQTGVLVSLDTTPVADDVTLREMLAPALAVAHMFTPNVEEASQVAGHFSRLAGQAREESARRGEPVEIENIVTPDDLNGIGEALLALGVPIAVITLGPQGAFLCTGSAASLRDVPLVDPANWANLRLYVPAFQVDGPINTTGAGDTFTAGLLTGLCQGLSSPAEIARLAHATGALHVDLSRGPCSFTEVQAALPTMHVRPPKNPHLMAEVMSFA